MISPWSAIKKDLKQVNPSVERAAKEELKLVNFHFSGINVLSILFYQCFF